MAFYLQPKLNRRSWTWVHRVLCNCYLGGRTTYSTIFGGMYIVSGITFIRYASSPGSKGYVNHVEIPKLGHSTLCNWISAKMRNYTQNKLKSRSWVHSALCNLATWRTGGTRCETEKGGEGWVFRQGNCPASRLHKIFGTQLRDSSNLVCD